MDSRDRQLRFLQGYALVSTTLTAVLALAAFTGVPQKQHFTEIDVERINLIEKDGTVRLAIANSDRMPHPTFYGKEYRDIRSGQVQRGAGMIYFNEEGTEVGGFVWLGRGTDDGGHRAAGLLTFDQYNQNEALSLSYSDVNGRRSAGLAVMDQPTTSLQAIAESLLVIQTIPDSSERARRMQQLRDERQRRGEVGAERLFVGRDPSKAAVLMLADPQGRPRLRVMVDSLGAPTIAFLDENGRVTRRLPEGQ
jgi:hypothetical protein